MRIPETLPGLLEHINSLTEELGLTTTFTGFKVRQVCVALLACYALVLRECAVTLSLSSYISNSGL